MTGDSTEEGGTALPLTGRPFDFRAHGMSSPKTPRRRRTRHLALSPEDKSLIEKHRDDRDSSTLVKLRLTTLLLAAEGVGRNDAADRVQQAPGTVTKTLRDFRRAGVTVLLERKDVGGSARNGVDVGRVVQLRDEGFSPEEIQQRLDISSSTVDRILRRADESIVRSAGDEENWAYWTSYWKKRLGPN
jgi:transposase